VISVLSIFDTGPKAINMHLWYGNCGNSLTALGSVPVLRLDTGRCSTRWWGESFRLLDDPDAHAAMARPVKPFGDGHAAERIVEALMAWGGDDG
jgi:hypothetical protein